MRNFIIACAVVFLLAGCMSEKVSFRRHPNLAEAQTAIQNALDRISRAQSVNEFDMGGHAQKAKYLLNEAYGEIKLAAETANAR
jgi:hypothetical protein